MHYLLQKCKCGRGQVAFADESKAWDFRDEVAGDVCKVCGDVYHVTITEE